MGEETTSTTDSNCEMEEFMTVPLDGNLIFVSSQDLLDWLKEDRLKFNAFVSVNKCVEHDYSQCLSDFINEYYNRYDVLISLASEMHCQKSVVDKSILDMGVEQKKKNFISAFEEFSDMGFFPMQGSIGMCAIGMSRIEANLSANILNQLPDVPQGMGWLYAMAALRKQQSKREKAAADIQINVKIGRDQLNALQKDIEEAQNKVVKYKKELDEFQKSALKSAALKSPANSLGKLERGHLVAALGLFALASVIVAAWATFIIKYYFPTVVAPLLAAKGWLPYETGAMVLTSVVLSGIVLTAVIILLRLAVARINFSVAAGERKAMAIAFRALLLKDAISDDQQMLFLQNIVGSKLPDYVNCNDIRLPADELNKMLQTALNSKKGE